MFLRFFHLDVLRYFITKRLARAILTHTPPEISLPVGAHSPAHSLVLTSDVSRLTFHKINLLDCSLVAQELERQGLVYTQVHRFSAAQEPEPRVAGATSESVYPSGGDALRKGGVEVREEAGAGSDGKGADGGVGRQATCGRDGGIGTTIAETYPSLFVASDVYIFRVTASC